MEQAIELVRSLKIEVENRVKEINALLPLDGRVELSLNYRAIRFTGGNKLVAWMPEVSTQIVTEI